MSFLYDCGVGQPPMNCNICGCRVRGEKCDKHMRESGFVALREKYVDLFVIREIKVTPNS